MLKSALDRPPLLACSPRGGSQIYSWWSHGGRANLVVLVPLVCLLLWYVAYLRLPPAGLELTLKAFFRREGGFWDRDWRTFADLCMTVLTAVFLTMLVTYRWARRKYLEFDGRNLRAWCTPWGPRGEVATARLRQLSVGREGALRCHMADEIVSLTSGPPEAMRYVEQQVEQGLRIEDKALEDEWSDPRWVEVESRQCPHCGHDMAAPPSASLSVNGLEAMSAPCPDGISRSLDGDRLTMTWGWTGMAALLFLLWLGPWDTFCSAVVLGGLGQVLHGNLGGLFVFLIPHVWIGIIFTYGWLGALLNQTEVRVTPERLTIRCFPIPYPGYPQELEIGLVEQFFVTRQVGSKGAVSHSLEVQMRSGSTRRLLSGLACGRAQALEKIIETHLGIQNRRVPGEVS